MPKVKISKTSGVDYLLRQLLDCGMLKVRQPFNLAIYKKAKEIEMQQIQNEIKNKFTNE